MARIDKRTNGKRLPDEEAQRRFEETNLGEKLAEALDLGPKET